MCYLKSFKLSLPNKNFENIKKMSDAIGIDAGSYKTVLACVKQRGIEIVLSETSSKWTPTIAAYTD